MGCTRSVPRDPQQAWPGQRPLPGLWSRTGREAAQPGNMRQDRDRRLGSMRCLPAGHCLVTGALWYRMARPVPALTTAAQHAFYGTPTFHGLTLWMVMWKCRMGGTEPCACFALRRCMSCDPGPHIAQPGFASTAVEYARANGMDPERSPPTQRALQRPHTSGTMGNDGLYGSTSERLRGAQSWCVCSALHACPSRAQLVASTCDLPAFVGRSAARWPCYAPNHVLHANRHGPPHELLPRQDLGPRLPPGGWRAAGTGMHLGKARASTAHGGPRQDETPGLRRARMYQ